MPPGSWRRAAYNSDLRTPERTGRTETPHALQSKDVPGEMSPPPSNHSVNGLSRWQERLCLTSTKGYFHFIKHCDPDCISCVAYRQDISTCLDIHIGVCWTSMLRGTRVVPWLFYFSFTRISSSIYFGWLHNIVGGWSKSLLGMR